MIVVVDFFENALSERIVILVQLIINRFDKNLFHYQDLYLTISATDVS